LAEGWGCGDMFRRWSSPEAVFRLLAEVTRGQPCDITGLAGKDYDAVEDKRGVQWPVPEGTTSRRPASAASSRTARRTRTWRSTRPMPASLGVEPSSHVLVQSRRGEMSARAFVTRTVKPGQVFVPMHFARTNQLTFAAFDRRSRQLAYKACAVRVRPLPEMGGSGRRKTDESPCRQSDPSQSLNCHCGAAARSSPPGDARHAIRILRVHAEPLPKA
jgi:assimilatory nitrate reductase catalytic subunit